MINSLGHYKVNEKVFTSKFEAFLYASKINAQVTFHYFDEVWGPAIDAFNYSAELSLPLLYKHRALQLRDKYNYLVLYYSGGSDSNTILDTFLDNNIKLDEIFVRWPVSMLGKYIASPYDKSPTNMLSEWDFAIKPKLDSIRVKHPNIKITIHDWTEDLKSLNITQDTVYRQNHNFGLPNYAFNESISKTAILEESKGNRVGHIFGVDKPNLKYYGNGTFYLQFNDATVMCSPFQHAHNKTDFDNRVLFFYAPEFPELTLAMAYAAVSCLKNHKTFLEFFKFENIVTYDSQTKTKIYEKYEKLILPSIYPTWNIKTFQAGKPNNFNKLYHPWFYYVFGQEEFSKNEKQVNSSVMELLKEVSPTLKYTNKNNVDVGLAMLQTKSFKLKSI